MRRYGSTGKVFLCVLLELASLTGAPLRPDEITALMQRLRRPAAVLNVGGERDDDRQDE